MKPLHHHHHRMRPVLIALGFLLLGAGAMWVALQGWTLPYVGLLVLCLGLLLHLLRREASVVPTQINCFLRALLNRDYTVHFPEEGQTELGTMYADMNRIVSLYHSSLADLKYKQDYYDRLLRIMTHELRNSLTPVTTLSSDMLKRPDNYSGRRWLESMELIHGQCMSVKSFLDDYHRLTHLPPPVRQTVDVEQLFVRMQALTGHPSVNFSWGKGMTLHADADQLTLVLTNLIRNALEATAGQAEARIEVMASEADKVPYISVTDNGPGIPEEELEEIFLPFYTTKPDGSGIGLSLCREIMHLHGGELTVSSHRGQGASFMLLFADIPPCP